MLRKILLLLVAAFFLCSCEGVRNAHGKVVDSESHDPLHSVFCEVLDGHHTMYTDSAGSFDLDGRFGGCAFGCPDMTIRFSKPGYREQTHENPEGKLTVYLEKE